MSKEKPKKKKAAPCVCGRAPCMVEHKARYMYACPDMLACSMRGLWKSTEQAAVHEWNTTVSIAKQEREAASNGRN